MVGTEMIAINDRRIVDDMTNMTEEIREHKIAELFRKIGDEVEFV
jgi:transcription elongation factor GreA-like protein